MTTPCRSTSFPSWAVTRKPTRADKARVQQRCGMEALSCAFTIRWAEKPFRCCAISGTWVREGVRTCTSVHTAKKAGPCRHPWTACLPFRRPRPQWTCSCPLGPSDANELPAAYTAQILSSSIREVSPKHALLRTSARRDLLVKEVGLQQGAVLACVFKCGRVDRGREAGKQA